MQGLALDRRPTPSDDTPTLAGTVGHIDSTVELDGVWARYKNDPTQADRDQLIVYYAPLVKFVASRIAAGLPQNVDQADLVSYGMFGLIDAIDKFDPGRGFKFETYAMARIKGAILDDEPSRPAPPPPSPTATATPVAAPGPVAPASVPADADADDDILEGVVVSGDTPPRNPGA